MSLDCCCSVWVTVKALTAYRRMSPVEIQVNCLGHVDKGILFQNEINSKENLETSLAEVVPKFKQCPTCRTLKCLNRWVNITYHLPSGCD